jgi:NAD-dependent dihydropyrimidine dehydrogenase PreA subunit
MMMMKIDISKCTGCGACAGVCPEQAITIRDNLAMIDNNLCTGCGSCAAVCPAGAIIGAVPVRRELTKGGERMYYGYGRGFGFRGSSPAWPYVGRGRGGLPRCWSPGLYGGVATYPGTWTAPYAPSREDELSFLRNQADAMKRDMAEIERRIQELEKKD